MRLDVQFCASVDEQVFQKSTKQRVGWLARVGRADVHRVSCITKHGRRIIAARSGTLMPRNPRPTDSNPRVEWFDRRDVWKVADSFAEFMASLKPLDAAS